MTDEEQQRAALHTVLDHLSAIPESGLLRPLAALLSEITGSKMSGGRDLPQYHLKLLAEALVNVLRREDEKVGEIHNWIADVLTKAG